MSETIEFTKDRATKTLSAAKELAPQWTWQEKTIPSIEAALVAIIGNRAVDPPIIGQEEVVSVAETTMLGARGAWDEQLDLLHRRTMQGVGMAKNRCRDDATKMVILRNLSARGTSRKETLEEALAWESAWAKVDPTWAPLSSNTLAAFKTLRKRCSEDLKTAYADAYTDWSGECGKLADMAASLEDTCQAWYADATRVFEVGTPEGNMIRRTIPTTYTPPHKPAPTPAPPKDPPAQ